MNPPTLERKTIRQIRDSLVERRFAIPKLQRNFVWDARRAAKLLDSIYYGMPIGSLFLWEMDKESAHLIRQSTDVLPSFNDKLTHVWFVIDGQQRLSVIHQAFRGEVRQNDVGREIDFGRLCFVVNPPKPGDGSEGPPPRRIVYRKVVDGEYVPLCDILAPEWKKLMPKKTKAFLDQILACRNRILSYPVPIVRVQKARIDEISEVFIRLNAQGMRITSADRAIALMGQLDVRLMADELRNKLREGGLALARIDPILMGFNLVSEPQHEDGDPPRLDAFARKWTKKINSSPLAREDFKKTWNAYQGAFKKAADYLRDSFGVLQEPLLPSANMLATLAVFFYHHSGQPNPYQRAFIKRWFWSTGIAQRYSGKGYHRNIVKDAAHFENLAMGKKATFSFTDYLDPVADLQNVEYSSRSSRSRAYFCLLASLKPRYLHSGGPIALDRTFSHANRKHRHHIFPRAQLRKHFPSKAYNSLVNICFVVAEENQKIGQTLPRTYLERYKGKTGHAEFLQAMRSHLIPAGKDSGVWMQGVVEAYKQFRSERLRLICGRLEKEAGIKLFSKDRA